MINIYVYDKNLLSVGLIDSYNSLIWASRYNDVGDCELYLPATVTNLLLLRDGYYLVRDDDYMVCQIKKIEIDTDSENGNYMIVTGYDTKRFLDQRIVWNTMNCDGNVEEFCRQLVYSTICNPALSSRQMKKADGTQLVYLGYSAGLTEVNTEQISYKNVGEKIREYCKTYGWGYRFILYNGVLWFGFYKGADRSSEVIFSDAYENLSTTKYTDDKSNMGNVALVGGAGEGAERARSVYGSADGLNRYEIFVDAKDVAKAITWEELTEIYPTTESGGQGYITEEGGTYVYKMIYVNVQIVDDDQLTWLQNNYPDGMILDIDGNRYYQTYNVVIAVLQTDVPEENSPAIIEDIIYTVYLLNRGVQKVAEYGKKITFEGTIIPNITFTYKKDYFLGDIVKVENEYGISVNARIVEIVEVEDENGYRVEPKFEYIQEV